MIYDEDIATKVLTAYGTGIALPEACEKNGITLEILFDWRWGQDGAPDDFQLRFERALEAYSEVCASTVMEAATQDEFIDPAIPKDLRSHYLAAAKLKIDSAKWLAERLNPNRYGSKSEMLVRGNPDAPIVVRKQHDLERARRILGIIDDAVGKGISEAEVMEQLPE